MKSKIKTFGIIALAAVIAFIITACIDILGNDKKDIDPSKYYLKAPTGIFATILPNTNTVHLTWDEVSGAKHYEISFRTNLDNPNIRLNINTTTSTLYDHNYSSYITEDVYTLYYYIKAHPIKTGYIASDWSTPVSVEIQ